MSAREYRVVGRSVPRVDGRAKVTGAARYTADVLLPQMLHGVAVRSARAHARLQRIETQAALALDGVVAVLTADDLAGLFPYYGHIITDHPVLANDKVRFAGEPVALVVAESLHVAQRAAGLVEVEYADLPVAVDLDAALADDAPVLHDVAYQRGKGVFWETVPTEHRGNVAHEAHLAWGKVDEAWEGAHVVVETDSRYPMLYAYAMEPYCAVASFSAGRLDVTSSTQHPFMVRAELARIFDMPLSQIRVTAPYVGGGYGSKSWTKVEPLAAVASWRCGRPVKVALSVEEAMLTTRADAARVRVRSAFDREGRFVAREFWIDFNTGAYADSSPSILDKAVHRCFGPYAIPNLRVTARLVYTNTVPASSYRGFGAPQTNVAGEYNVDRAAHLLGINPVDLRRRNALAPGDQVLPKRRPLDADIAGDIDLLVEALGSSPAAPPGSAVGVGFGCSVSDAGSYPASTAMVRLLPDGSALVSSGAVEIGQGSATVLSQIAAEELGIPLDRVSIAQSDTATTPYERTTNGSRTTTVVGLAVQEASHAALRRVRDMAAEVWSCDAETIRVADGTVAGPGDRRARYAEIINAWFGSDAGEAVGIGTIRPDGKLALLPPFYEIGMSGVILQIDLETGQVRVRRLATVGDIGFAINPAAAEAQDLGAATQGLGGALYEQLVYEGGQLINPNLVDYRIPRVGDMPAEIRSVLAERQDGVGPYGAKGGGEGALNPIGGAVASAVARALGVWPDRIELPLTPERIWRLARESRG